MINISWAIKPSQDGAVLRRTDENGNVWWVPEAPGNRHYEEYLEWVEAGGVAEVIGEAV